MLVLLDKDAKKYQCIFLSVPAHQFYRWSLSLKCRCFPSVWFRCLTSLMLFSSFAVFIAHCVVSKHAHYFTTSVTSVDYTTRQVSHALLAAHKAPVYLFPLIAPWDFYTASAPAEVLALISHCSRIFKICLDNLPSWEKRGNLPQHETGWWIRAWTQRWIENSSAAAGSCKTLALWSLL